MYDSLDLNNLAERIRQERHASTVNWWIFGAIIAGFILLIGLFYSAAVTSTDPCQVNQFCRLFSLTFSLLPILVVFGFMAVTVINHKQRRVSAKQYLNRLTAFELPLRTNFWKSPGSILVIICIAIILVYELSFPDNVGIAFLALFLVVAVPIYGMSWVRAPLLLAHYDEVIRRANVYDRWFPGTSLNTQSITETFAGYVVESEQTNRKVLARFIRAKSLESLALNNLAFELVLQERYEEALPLLESAILINPHYALSYDTLAWWYLLQNLDPQRALELAEFGLRLPSPRSSIYKTASMAIKLATRAWAEARAGQAEQAEATIKDALKKATPKNIPYYASLLFTLGQVEIALNDLSTAYNYFSQAAEIDPHGRFGKMSADHLKRLNHPT